MGTPKLDVYTYKPPGSVCGSTHIGMKYRRSISCLLTRRTYNSLTSTVADRILRVFASAVFVARKCFLCIFKSTDLVVRVFGIITSAFDYLVKEVFT